VYRTRCSEQHSSNCARVRLVQIVTRGLGTALTISLSLVPRKKASGLVISHASLPLIWRGGKQQSRASAG
jgi:hypothetical protein